MKKMTREEKNKQIRKEAFWTIVLFLICFAWHVGFGYGLANVNIRFFHLPLWWLVSTPGVFIVALIGVTLLLKKVFVNFDLDDCEEDQNE